MGLRLNRELFLVYFIIYSVITAFYKDSAGSTYLEYLRLEDVIRAVGASLGGMIDRSAGIVMEEAERYYPTGRFRAIAENYFENNRGRLYEIMNAPKEEKADAAD